MTDVPDGAKVIHRPCPRCAGTPLYIEARLVAKPLGTYSISGTELKLVAEAAVFLVCTSCQAEVKGTIEPGMTHATFDSRVMINCPDKDI